ncbi:MAG: hypothetical protein ABL930_11435 [Pseudobdellovibrio sp.]
MKVLSSGSAPEAAAMAAYVNNADAPSLNSPAFLTMALPASPLATFFAS